MRLFDVWDESRGETRIGNELGQVEADDHQQAAELFCGQCDFDGSGDGYTDLDDYARIHVAEVGSSEVFVVRVCAEMVPSYTAMKVVHAKGEVGDV
jgi:hypothetical protein